MTVCETVADVNRIAARESENIVDVADIAAVDFF